MSTLATAGARWPARMTKTGSFAGMVAVVLMLVAGPAYRLGVLSLSPALLGAAAAFLLFFVAFLIGGIGLLAQRRHAQRSSRTAVVIVVLAGLATIFAGFWAVRLRSAPPIHDITTDFEDPPEFRDIVPLRKAARAVNSVEYQRIQRMAGRDIDVIEAQRRAYPDVQPLILPQGPPRALELAEQAARAMGWNIVAAAMTAVPAEGRVEATDATWYFGFKDDVVIRVRADAGGSRVDIRSASRVGVSDVGANAARIRKYEAQLRRLAGVSAP
ncbi:MAG: DUF1499 domain-containing protein [Sphingopyxis sp.]